MSALINPRYERFARFLAEGYSQAISYAAAGFTPDDSNASRLTADDRIKRRVAELQGAAAEQAELSVAWVLEKLKEVAEANLADFITLGPDGEPVTDFAMLTRAQAAALCEVTVEEFTDGRGDDARQVRRVKFKLYDKLSAIEKIAKHLGMFVDRAEMKLVTISSELPTEEEWEREHAGK